MAWRIGVVGCGAAGQAASILLARAGHDVHVFEQAPRDEPVGAGLLIQPTGLEILHRLGVGGRLRELAAPIHRLHGVTDRGRTVMDLHYHDLRAGLFGLGVQRAALARELHAVMESQGVGITFGTTIKSYEIVDRVAFLLDHDGGRHGPLDLIIVADGARSALRQGSKLVRRESQYAWGALWCILDHPESLAADTLAQVYRGTSRMIGILPSGRLGADAPNRISLFWSVRAGDWSGPESFDLKNWKNQARALTSRMDGLLAQIADPRQLIFAPYFDVVLRAPSHGPIVYIGDAAHATSPQLGHGVNLALVDAAILADALARESLIVAGLARYTRLRRRHVRYYQFASRWLMPAFQSNLEPLALPRDFLGGPMCRIPPLRHQMLLTLAGVKTGLFRHLPLP